MDHHRQDQWDGKLLRNLDQDELAQLADELTSELPPHDPMREVVDRLLRQHRGDTDQ